MQVTQIENVGTLAGRHSGVNSNQFLSWCGVGGGFGLLKLLWKMVVSAVGDASGWPWFNARHVWWGLSLVGMISNLGFQISNLKSQISNLKSQILLQNSPCRNQLADLKSR
jgi:hypothetical protein